MSEMKRDWREQFISWVNGEREPKDRTLFVMERRDVMRQRPSDREHAQREVHRLHRFLRTYPMAASALCAVLLVLLLAVVEEIPDFGAVSSPVNNEVAEYYLEHSLEDTGSENVVTGIILSYRGFDTLGESCVLFLAVSCVTLLLRRKDGEEEEDDADDLRRRRQEEELRRSQPDVILREAGKLLIPCIFLFAFYVLVNGEESPGGGFSGGTVLGCGLVLCSVAYGPEFVRRFFNSRIFGAVRTFGLTLYLCLYGFYIFMGANGLTYSASFVMAIDLAVGLVVACTVYGFFALFSKGEI